MKISKTFIRQILLYGIIGGGSASLDFVLFFLICRYGGINELLANVVSVHAGIVSSFLLNRNYNFKKADRVLFRSISFYLTAFFGLLLSEGMLLIGGWLSLSVSVVKLVSIFIVAVIQFTINKLVAFRN